MTPNINSAHQPASSRVAGASPSAAARGAESATQSPAGRDQGDPRAASGPAAVVQLGSEARALAKQSDASERGVPEGSETTPRALELKPDKASAAEESKASNELSEAEKQEVQEMKARDREVRTHEQAHKSAGGQYTGAIQVAVERGPDGGSYAVSGHVDIDISPVKGDAEATIRKMAVVARAANAPADPSAADRSVAAKAAQTASQARAELAAQNLETSEGGVRGARAGAAPSEAHGVGHAADVSEAQLAALEDAQQSGERKPLNLVA